MRICRSPVRSDAGMENAWIDADERIDEMAPLIPTAPFVSSLNTRRVAGPETETCVWEPP